MSGKGTPTRLIAETDFLQFVKDLLSIVKEESRKRMVDAEAMSSRIKDRESLQWYFRGYKDGVHSLVVAISLDHAECGPREN